MLSVYFHAHGPASLTLDDLILLDATTIDEMPREFRPIPLDDALRLLREDPSDHNLPNRARALAKLNGARLADDRTHELLGARGQILPPPSFGETRLELENAAYALDGELFNFTGPRCMRRLPQLSVGLDTKTSISTVDLSLEIYDPIAANLPQRVDPQNWSVCNDYFAATHIGALGPDLPIWSATGDVEEMENPPDPGSTWHGQLFEHFEIPWNLGSTSTIKNLLKVDFQSGTRRMRHDYELSMCLYTRFYSDIQLGGIDPDDGFVRVETLDHGWIRFEGQKNIRYTYRESGSGIDRVLNRMTPWLYTTFMEAEFHNAACCSGLGAPS
jgi:hypothetical protein